MPLQESCMSIRSPRAFVTFIVTASFLTSPVLTSSAARAADSSSQTVKTSVEQVLRAQQDAWNRHDLEGFMIGYWNSPDLSFFSGGRETSGWQGALERYRRTYQSEGKEMGKLEFSDLRIEPLGSDAAFVRGAWHLTMSDGKTPHGLFTLVFRKFPGGWKIVHDHTSAE
jgi:beta-aspartyl-peptidase (threonine type)